jgi:hypothetical protein
MWVETAGKMPTSYECPPDGDLLDLGQELGDDHGAHRVLHVHEPPVGATVSEVAACPGSVHGENGLCLEIASGYVKVNVARTHGSGSAKNPSGPPHERTRNV